MFAVRLVRGFPAAVVWSVGHACRVIRFSSLNKNIGTSYAFGELGRLRQYGEYLHVLTGLELNSFSQQWHVCTPPVTLYAFPDWSTDSSISGKNLFLGTYVGLRPHTDVTWKGMYVHVFIFSLSLQANTTIVISIIQWFRNLHIIFQLLFFSRHIIIRCVVWAAESAVKWTTNK